MHDPTPSQQIETLITQAGVAHRQGQLSSAIELLRQALKIDPNNFKALHGMAVLLGQSGRTDEAVTLLSTAAAIQPNNFAVHFNRGNLLHLLKRYDEALDSYSQAITIKPDFREAYINRGNILRKVQRWDEALSDFDAVVAMTPDSADAIYNRSNVLMDMQRYEEAAAGYTAAIALNGEFTDAYNNLGYVYKLLGRLEDALLCYQQALRLDPTDAARHSNLLLLQNYRSDLSAAALYAEHVRWAELHGNARAQPTTHSNTVEVDRRLRIGYISADFKNHPVGFFIEDVLAQHDRERFTIFCYSNSTTIDEQTTRLRMHVDHWRNIVDLTDEAAAELIRSDAIDILIDLSGHTAGHRLLVLARKPAPVQATWLGYINTTGLSTVDYIIADRHVIPIGDEPNYVEEVVRLPNNYLCFTPPRFDLPVGPLPALTRQMVTFGCFNNTGKLTPSIIATWAKLLAAMPKSRLLLKSMGFNSERTKERYQRMFTELGIDPERLDFAGPSSRKEYIAGYQQVDIGLDPFPYTGGTTTFEALWMGVPVITLSGDRFVSRVGESILLNVNLEECVAHTEDEYITKAVTLASDLSKLAELRAALRNQLIESSLCDGRGFTRNLEAAYRDMWARWCQTVKN